MHPTEATAVRARARFVHHQRVAATPEEVFPLLCPERERDWIPTWDCEIVHSVSGLAEEDCVFRTVEPDGRPDTWVVSVFEPPRRIQFVRVHPRRTIRYDIRLESDGDTTTLRWEQVITGLDAEGDRSVRELRADDYAARIERIEAQLAHYLRTGEALGGG